MLTWWLRCEAAFSWLQRPSVADLMTRSCLKLIRLPWTLCARDQKRQLKSIPLECRRWQRKLSLASQALHWLRSWWLSIYLGDRHTTALCMTAWQRSPALCRLHWTWSSGMKAAATSKGRGPEFVTKLMCLSSESMARPMWLRKDNQFGRDLKDGIVKELDARLVQSKPRWRANANTNWKDPIECFRCHKWVIWLGSVQAVLQSNTQVLKWVEIQRLSVL